MLLVAAATAVVVFFVAEGVDAHAAAFVAKPWPVVAAAMWVDAQPEARKRARGKRRAMGRWIQRGLACSAVGDVLLAVRHPTPSVFAAGVGAFAAAHAAYVAAFTRETGWARSAWADAVVGTVVAGVVLATAVGAVRLEGATTERLEDSAALLGGLKDASGEQLHKAVWLLAAYTTFIGVMAWRALARWDLLRSESGWWGAVGASLFVVSDAVLGYGMFVGKFPAWSFVVMSTYYAAQGGMALAATKR